MNRNYFFAAFMLVLLLSAPGFAQPDRPLDGGPPGPPPERLERYRKMRLIEVLKLKEEESVRFFAKQAAHEEKIRDFMRERNESLDDMEEALEKKSNADIMRYSDKVTELDERIFKERQRFQDEIKKLLSPEQYAKFLIFERNFGRKVRDAMEDVYKGKRERYRGGHDMN